MVSRAASAPARASGARAFGAPVLHPTDLSAASRPAFKKALEIARAAHSELVLLHVIDPVVPIPSEGYIPPKLYEEIRTSAHAWAQKKLDRLVAEAAAAGVPARSTIAEGVAHEAIVRAARALRASMVVMGTHGRTGVRRLIAGSVATRVVSQASCPVLTVRAH